MTLADVDTFMSVLPAIAIVACIAIVIGLVSRVVLPPRRRNR
jgi:hypothetical protein